jgi:hypothetical protein
LEEIGVGGRDRGPPQGVQVCGESVFAIEALRSHGCPRFIVEDPGVDLALPKDLECESLSVVVDAGQSDEGLFARATFLNAINEVLARANADHLVGDRDGRA